MRMSSTKLVAFLKEHKELTSPKCSNHAEAFEQYIQMKIEDDDKALHEHIDMAFDEMIKEEVEEDPNETILRIREKSIADEDFYDEK